MSQSTLSPLLNTEGCSTNKPPVPDLTLSFPLKHILSDIPSPSWTLGLPYLNSPSMKEYESITSLHFCSTE